MFEFEPNCDLIRQPPPHGVHNWEYTWVCRCRERGMSAAATMDLARRELIGRIPRPGRVITERDIRVTIRNVFNGPVPRRPGSPAFTIAGPVFQDPARHEVAYRDGWPETMRQPPGCRNRALIPAPDAGGVEGLKRSSPCVIPESPLAALVGLYEPTDLLCIGSLTQFECRTLGEWTAVPLNHLEFIVPNPNRKRVGVTREGNRSARCRDATGPRRYSVVESDVLSEDEQANFLRLLARSNRLAAVVRTGGKSLHGWVVPPCDDQLMIWRWYKALADYGADTRMFLPEQFCRLPCGHRKTGERQEVVYWDPPLRYVYV